MGTIEAESKKRAKRNQMKKIILETIKVAGMVSIGVMAPNVIGSMAKLGLIKNPRQRELIRRSVDRMYGQGLLKHGSKGLSLTERGERALRSLTLKTFGTKRPFRWDKKWRVLVFDIPETRRKLRDEIRRTLIGNGFIRLQDSVWVYPYDCEDWINLWKAELQVGRELLYLIVDSIEGDFVLRRNFDL